MGNVLVPLALFGWIPFTVFAYAVLSPRRAFLTSMVLGWLFLPVATYELPGFVDYTKDVAVPFSVLIGMLVFDSDRLARGAFHRYDLPIAVWCLCPMATSIWNELGFYDGLSGVLDRAFIYYLPYVLGRIYLASFAGLRELAVAWVLGALVYTPLCVWEIRMSPQLHVQLYGYFAHEGGFAQVFRYGGWRPMVFQHHGLMLGLFMAMGAFLAFALWITKAKRDLFGIPMSLCFLVLAAVNVLIKSTGAAGLLAGGVVALATIRWWRISLPYWAVVLVPLVYVVLRAPGWWDGANVVQLVDSVLGPDRAHSLSYRLEAEGLLAGKAMEQPIFGWGEHDRGRVAWDKSPDGMVVPDGLWIQAFNVNGIVGITSLLLAFLLPAWLLGRKLAPRQQLRTELGLITALSMLTALFMIDSLMNAMLVPMYFAALGGVAGYLVANPGRFRRANPRLVYRPSQVRWLLHRKGQMV